MEKKSSDIIGTISKYIERKHYWMYDDTIWDSISDCFRCKYCGLSQLIYEGDEYFKINVKCEGNNVGRFVTSKDVDFDSEAKDFIVVSHKDKE